MWQMIYYTRNKDNCVLRKEENNGWLGRKNKKSRESDRSTYSTCPTDRDSISRHKDGNRNNSLEFRG